MDEQKEYFVNNVSDGANIGGSTTTPEPDKRITTYTDLYKSFNPEPDEKAFEQSKKKEKRKQLFSAISDGISALSNLFFTTQGAPNMYTGKNTLSARSKISYDKLINDHNKNKRDYYNGLHNAMLADDRLNNEDRNWRRILRNDEKEEKRYQDKVKYQQERDNIADARYTEEKEYRKERDKKADEWREKQNKFNYAKLYTNANAREEARKNKARGKRLGFANGDKQVSIYENVWKGSMQQVFNSMIEDQVDRGLLSESAYKQIMNSKNSREKEDFVKQNWHKSSKATTLMNKLSQMDPALIESNIDDEDYSQYEQGDDEDYSQYEVK